MSKTEMKLVLEPPYGGQAENVDVRGLRCPVCFGEGYLVTDDFAPDEDGWKRCPLCHGSGMMRARVHIEWEPESRSE